MNCLYICALYMPAHIYMHVCLTHICVHVYVCICACVCMRVFAQVHVCIYPHILSIHAELFLLFFFDQKLR
jgi:hypothetical protein